MAKDIMPHHGPSGGIGEYPGDYLLGLPGEYDPTQIKNDIQLCFSFWRDL
jgi:hypothetical protein